MGQAFLIKNSERIILFDGVCNLCNGFVQFIIKRDPEQIFRFASLQSDFAKKLIEQHPQLKNVDAVVFWEENKLFIKSDAAFAIAQYLPKWKWIGFLKIFPRFLRDGVYDLIAKYRYRILGKKDQCMIPSPALKERFIS
jgi:predicted DCC family thiol-disulfide oxidoreductase YuxK